MDRLLVVGVDSVAGRSVASQLAARSEVCGLWTVRPDFLSECTASRLDAESLSKKCQAADVLVFCGGAARSSWDAEFGNFEIEDQWLSKCIQTARETHTKFVFVSSDAVFGGPWVFHDDDSSSFAETKVAKRIRQFESLVENETNSLIVRTNVLAMDPLGRSVAARILERLQTGECEHVDAQIFATPIAASDFAQALAECLLADMTGVINIAGAERTTAFHFAIAFASVIGCGTEHLIPTENVSRTTEQSLRCNRLRSELKITTPTLRETVERVAEPVLENVRKSVAA